MRRRHATSISSRELKVFELGDHRLGIKKAIFAAGLLPILEAVVQSRETARHLSNR